MGGGPSEPSKSSGLQSIELSKGWFYRQSDNSDPSWIPAKKVPSDIHQDLVESGKLKDPFHAFEALKAEWVGTKSWTYRLNFDSPSMGPASKAVLAFDGLDTFAKVSLDGQAILASSNMFLPARVDVTEQLSHQAHHELQIVFDSALLKAEEIRKAFPEHKWICWNGESSRLAVRKAQYHWGWDWGPKLMCAGIWRPIRLEIFTARIDALKIKAEIDIDYTLAIVHITTDIEPSHLAGLRAVFQISLKGEIVSERSSCVLPNGCADVQLLIESPSLWMPAGYGSQKLYDVRVTLLSGTTELHSVRREVGLRRIELIQQPDQIGKSFYFKINGLEIFCGGSCWVPADSFLANVSQERYRAWLKLLVAGNQKMIRVWGGGIYEQDCFYEICDELGILVWQDCPFACGNYPYSSSFFDSIRQETTLNLRRLRHHASLIVIAGNNEDYQVAESAGLAYEPLDTNPENWLQTDFPARYIYERLLPEIVREECPGVLYHPGSPWGDGKRTSDPTVGDLHQWNVWHGTQEKYQRYAELGGRFNSEFGMEALPHLETVISFLGPDMEDHEKYLHPQSALMDFHNKADGHERRLAIYMAENVRTNVKSLRSYIHLSQLIQCEALTAAYRSWRRQWGRAGSRLCGGALVWQLNDCWPVISWSIVDYYLRPKPAFYGIKRCLAPIAVGVRREHWDWSLGHARKPESQSWQAWCISSKLEDLIVNVEISFWQVESGIVVKEPIFKRGLLLPANSTMPVAEGIIDNRDEPSHVLAVRVYHDGAIVARDMDWPQPLKHLPFPERNVRVETGAQEMRITADRPVKCLVFEERDGCKLSDNALDLAPGDEQVIQVTGLKEGDPPLRGRYLGQEEQ